MGKRFLSIVLLASWLAHSGLQALDAKWHMEVVQAGDNLAKIFQRLHISQEQLQQILALGDNVSQLHLLYPQQQLKFLINNNQLLEKFIYPLSTGKRLLVIRIGPEKFMSTFEEEVEGDNYHPPEYAVVSGSINRSLAHDAKAAGLNNKQILQITEIFDFQINYQRELRRGDQFIVICESTTAAQVCDGEILAAQIKTHDKNLQAIRFTDERGNTQFFAPNGQALVNSFDRKPVNYTRISSKFNPKRLHPVLNVLRPHFGVDFAAPKGNPVRAANDGWIDFKGYKGGYGNVVYIQHSSRYSTRYAHLDGFPQGLKRNQAIKKGEVIGYVGQTGLATGPHLHFELRVDGSAKDPLTATLPYNNPVPNTKLAEFNRIVEELLPFFD